MSAEATMGSPNPEVSVEDRKNVAWPFSHLSHLQVANFCEQLYNCTY